MVRMVAVDMDGTFLNRDHDYDRPRFARLYRTMSGRGIKFVVASGNQYYQLRSFFPGIEAEISFVAENGALVIAEGEELFCGEMDGELVRDTLMLLRDLPGVSTVLCGRNSAYVAASEEEWFKTETRRYYHRLREVGDLLAVRDDKLFKFALAVPAAQTEHFTDLLRTHLGTRLEPVSSGHGSIDLIIPGLHKANGIALLQRRWSIPDAEVAAFGDGGNDVEMLARAGRSFAMAGSPPAVVEAAKEMAPSCDDDGVLIVLERLLDEETPG